MRIVDEWKGYIEKNIFNVKIGFVMWTLYRLDLALLTMIMDYGKVHQQFDRSLHGYSTIPNNKLAVDS